ncbi:meiosis-specific APC/C activator protein AMA1 [Cryomyces antarcticus]
MGSTAAFHCQPGYGLFTPPSSPTKKASSHVDTHEDDIPSPPGSLRKARLLFPRRDSRGTPTNGYHVEEFGYDGFGVLTPPTSPHKLRNISGDHRYAGLVPIITSDLSPRKPKRQVYGPIDITLSPPESPSKSSVGDDQELWSPVPTSPAFSDGMPQFDGIDEQEIDDTVSLRSSFRIQHKVSDKCDGQGFVHESRTSENDMDEDLAPVWPTPPTSPSTQRYHVHTNHSPVNLTLPIAHALPSPTSTEFDQPTPLIQATPAIGAFPFPRQGRLENVLSSLSLRRHPAPLLRSGQRVLSSGGRSQLRAASQTPDRFIPKRSSGTSSRDSFHFSKPPEKLTTAERLVRQRTVGPDPFSRTIRSRTRPATQYDSMRGPRVVHGVLTRLGSTGVLGLRRNIPVTSNRAISSGGIWNVGGTAPAADTVRSVSDGRGGRLASGTNAPLYRSLFLNRTDPKDDLEVYESRVALALGIDQSSRILGPTSPIGDPGSPLSSPQPASSSSGALSSPSRDDSHLPTVWRDNEWITEGSTTPQSKPEKAKKNVPICLMLLLSETTSTVPFSPTLLPQNALRLTTPYSAHVTSLSFSSLQGGQAILAVGRADGRVTLWSPMDTEPRFDAAQPSPVSCVSFRPNTVRRPSIRDPAFVVNVEELLVGDEAGHVYFYSIEWPSDLDRDLFGWHGAMTLLARMTLHTQQVCGLAWSPDGELFATGGNDNACFLCETRKILSSGSNHSSGSPTVNVRPGTNGNDRAWDILPGQGAVLSVQPGMEKHKSHTRREIAATFGFAQPDHLYRVAVFAWPSCEQVVAIPWLDEHRALYAISYPGGPNGTNEELDGHRERSSIARSSASRAARGGSTSGSGEGGTWYASRTHLEGCIVVATSDASIKFHEIWPETPGRQLLGFSSSQGIERRPCGGISALGSSIGGLGGSSILKGLEGIEETRGAIR